MTVVMRQRDTLWALSKREVKNATLERQKL
jgi:nucleoid-associated protein YgaU